MQPALFKTKYLLRILRKDYNPFTPDTLLIDENMIVHKRRNWFLISVDTQSYHFQNVIGVDVNKGLFGANLAIETTGSGKIVIRGFSKRTANSIRNLCSNYISKNSSRNTTENLASSIVSAIKNNNKPQGGISDELTKLKSLLDSGVLTNDEYERQKQKLLN